MARDGLLPPAFAASTRAIRTPYVATILTGVFVAGFAAVASLDEMVDLTNIGTLFAFILVCAGIIILRRREPHRVRPFRVPSGWRWAIAMYALFALGVFFVPLGPTGRAIALAAGAAAFALARNHVFPALGIVSCLYLVWYLPPTSWLRFAAWLNFGFVVYVGYGAAHSRLAQHEHHERPAEHLAHTAFTGAWLAAAGTALLFATRGFDLWLGAIHTRAAETPAAAAAALRDVFAVAPGSRCRGFSSCRCWSTPWYCVPSSPASHCAPDARLMGPIPPP